MSRGFVATPEPVVERMVRALEPGAAAQAGLRVLEPGCGTCTFLVHFVSRYARHAKAEGLGARWVAERLRGIELDPPRAREARVRVRAAAAQEGLRLDDAALDQMLICGDFLKLGEGPWDVIVGNPPYVRLEGMAHAERREHGSRFQTAKQRYDLYFLFFEQALRLLAPGGRLAYVTPQKYMRVWSGGPLRDLLATRRLDELDLLPENSFPGYIVYPAITRLRNEKPTSNHHVRIRRRTGEECTVPQNRLGAAPWSAVFSDESNEKAGLVLRDVAHSIAVGVATGADGTYIIGPETAAMLPSRYVKRTVSGRQLSEDPASQVTAWDLLVWPYDQRGALVPEAELKEVAPKLHDYLWIQRRMLEKRTCFQRGARKWYEFHERPRVQDYARPKILGADIQRVPTFRIDREGFVPRHSVYYVVPKSGVEIDALCAHLNSTSARRWLLGHCQPAAGGRVRVQSRVLADLPVPESLRPLEVVP